MFSFFNISLTSLIISAVFFVKGNIMKVVEKGKITISIKFQQESKEECYYIEYKLNSEANNLIQLL